MFDETACSKAVGFPAEEDTACWNAVDAGAAGAGFKSCGTGVPQPVQNLAPGARSAPQILHFDIDMFLPF